MDFYGCSHRCHRSSGARAKGGRVVGVSGYCFL